MIEDTILNVINTTVNSFDFAFCIVVNIATYLIIKYISNIKKKRKLTTWNKRLVFIIASIVLSIVYYNIGSDIKVLINSVIIAPVSWSWIFKPICKKFNIDYSKKDNIK